MPSQNTAQTELNKTKIIPLISDDDESDDAFASAGDDAFANNEDGDEMIPVLGNKEVLQQLIW